MITKFKKSHKYVSVIVMAKEETNFSRVRRLTIVYCAILGVLTSNAFSFQNDKKESGVKWLVSAVLSSIITSPFVFLLAFLFRMTLPIPKDIYYWFEHVCAKQEAEIELDDIRSGSAWNDAHYNRFFD